MALNPYGPSNSCVIPGIGTHRLPSYVRLHPPLFPFYCMAPNYAEQYVVAGVVTSGCHCETPPEGRPLKGFCVEI
jgi:hypothetical protein